MTLMMVFLVGFRANAYSVSVTSEAYAYAGGAGAYAYAYAGDGDAYAEVLLGDEWYEWPEEVELADVPEQPQEEIWLEAPEQPQEEILLEAEQEVSYDEPIAPYGSYGTLKIYGSSSINRSLDLVNTEVDPQYAQAIVDDPNKAIALDHSWYWGKPVSLIIGDHGDQGFDELHDMKLGTICEIFYPDGQSQQYVLRETTRDGINDKILVYAYGSPAELVHTADWICMYTCNPGGSYSVTVTFWEPLQ